jgi:tetratricopeptide (TPR) repeat protein
VTLFLRFLFLSLAFCCAAVAQPAKTAETLAILPFENKSGTPGLDWIGDSFPEVLGDRMSSDSLYVVRREERLLAFDRVGIPTNVRPSRASCYRVAQELAVDYLVIGRFEVDGNHNLKVTAQLLRMSTLRLGPEVMQEGLLPKLLKTQTALAWDLLAQFDQPPQQNREQFLKGAPTVRVDAFENYMRGLLAGSQPDQIRHLKEALRLSPDYGPALLQLGKIYYMARDYPSAVASLRQVSRNDTSALEANFYLGLAAYYAADFSRAETAFALLAGRFPAAEIYNNLGVVTSRRGKQAAIDHFRKAVDADPQEPDYRFNLAVNLYRQGDLAAAASQLREMLALRSNDSEAQGLLDTVNRGLQTGSSGARTFPLERIKTEYDDANLRHSASGNQQSESKSSSDGARQVAH